LFFRALGSRRKKFEPGCDTTGRNAESPREFCFLMWSPEKSWKYYLKSRQSVLRAGGECPEWRFGRTPMFKQAGTRTFRRGNTSTNSGWGGAQLLPYTRNMQARNRFRGTESAHTSVRKSRILSHSAKR